LTLIEEFEEHKWNVNGQAPAVSVIMPVYNAERSVGFAIRSILKQSFQPFELIIVDDGSTDQTPEILAEWQQRDQRIRVHYRQHEGIVAALNHGIAHSSAPLIARMDADDISLPERLEKQVRELKQNPELGLVGTQVRFGGDEEENLGYKLYVDWTNSLTDPMEIAMHRFVESPFAHPTVMFRRSLIKKYGGYRDGSFPEDYELWLRWLEKGVKMSKIPEELLIWHDDPQRLSRSHDRYSTDAFYKIKAKYLAHWLEMNNPHHPQVVVFGAGRVTRKRVDYLKEQGIEIAAYVDIDPDKIGNKYDGAPVWAPDELPLAGDHFVVSYVGSRGANNKIAEFLDRKGYSLSLDYIFAA
jgi:glycosyltransferase involved in cell wall biosynthesis